MNIWVIVLGAYLLVGMFRYGLGMLSPGYIKEIEECRKKGTLRFLILGVILGALFWPVAFIAFFLTLKSKRAGLCPECGAKTAWSICPKCGPLQIRSGLTSPEQEAKFQQVLQGIDDPQIKEAAVRTRAEVESDPGLTLIRRKMSTLKRDDPERKSLGEQLDSAAREIFMRHYQAHRTENWLTK